MQFAKAGGMSVCPVYGGVSKWEQTKELRKGHEVLVATPKGHHFVPSEDVDALIKSIEEEKAAAEEAAGAAATN